MADRAPTTLQGGEKKCDDRRCSYAAQYTSVRQTVRQADRQTDRRRRPVPSFTRAGG